MADRFRSGHENGYPPRVLTACLLGTIQVYGLQSSQPSLKLTFTKSVFIWRTLPFPTGIQRFTHLKVCSSSSGEARVTDGDRSSEFTSRACQLEWISEVLTEGGTMGQPTLALPTLTMKFLLLNIFRQKKKKSVFDAWKIPICSRDCQRRHSWI